MGHRTFQHVLDQELQKDPSVDYKSVLLPEVIYGDPLARMVRALVAPPKRRYLARLRSELAGSFAARRQIDYAIPTTGHPKVLHIHTQALALLLKTPDVRRYHRAYPSTVISLDCTAPLLARNSALPQMDLWLLSWLERHALRRARFVVAWTDWAARSVTNDYDVPVEHVRVIPPPVHIPTASPYVQEATSRSSLHLLFVGNGFARKGGWDLLAALQHDLSHPWTLDVVCSDPDLCLPTATLPITQHRGLTHDSPELQRLYQQADLFVLPTREDAAGLVLLEAMAHGLPILTTDVMGVPEMVGGPGKCAILVPPSSPRHLREAISSLASSRDLRHRLGREGLDLVKTRNSASKVAAQFAKVFSDAACGGRGLCS